MGDCKVQIHRLVFDVQQPGLFAVERSFECINRETGLRGVDEDWAIGEVVPYAADPQEDGDFEDGIHESLQLRYCRVYFEAHRSCQEKNKSTGAKFGWDMPNV